MASAQCGVENYALKLKGQQWTNTNRHVFRLQIDLEYMSNSVDSEIWKLRFSINFWQHSDRNAARRLGHFAPSTSEPSILNRFLRLQGCIVMVKSVGPRMGHKVGLVVVHILFSHANE